MGCLTCFQSVSDFSQRSLCQTNSEKNKFGCTDVQPQQGGMSIETINWYYEEIHDIISLMNTRV